MGLFDWLTGTRRPAPGTAPASPEAVRAAILAVSRDTAPFVVRPATADDAERADLVSEWRMHQPIWYPIFAAASVRASFQTFMRLAPETHEVRTIDRSSEVSWSADGRPSFSAGAKFARGQQYEFRAGIEPFYEETADGHRIAFKFSSSELKEPLRAAVTGAGWTWRGVSTFF